ncbi:hypothetical protein ACRTDM_11270 [Shewanella algae]|uniref:hypothetical protein n=2 Tax=Shewanella algae TaxID=38313 RepID=UPI003003DEDF
MATEWIDIIDTSVKIGLGALISGIATYKVSSLNHQKEVSRALINKKINIIEEISELAERYFYFSTSLSNAIGGMQRSAGNLGEPLTDPQWKRVRDLHQDFNVILEARNKAISKIKILSIDKAEEAIFEHNEFLSELRNIIVFEKNMPTVEKREELSAKFIESKDKFYRAIGNYMESIGT